MITYFSILFFMSFSFYREHRSFWTSHLALNSFYIQLLFCSHWFVPPFIFQPFYILKWTRTIYFLKYKWLMGYSFFLFGDFPSPLKNKKKAFYKPIALSYAINSFFFISGCSPKRSTVLAPLDRTSLSYYRSQAFRLHFAEPFSSLFREEALRIAFFFACLYYSTRNFFCK